MRVSACTWCPEHSLRLQLWSRKVSSGGSSKVMMAATVRCKGLGDGSDHGRGVEHEHAGGTRRIPRHGLW